ncbi:hypothetical protein M0R04_11955 [Candidatus Dojkabacteria bacterium]|nr:hypothetical protein [Candidatus Dojkabacteria bacterium]
MNLICPECNTELERKLGLPGVVCDCPKCKKRWIKCVDRLVSLEEIDNWHGV